MAADDRFSGRVYFGRISGVEEAVRIMHVSLDPLYRGNAIEYLPKTGDIGAPRVGTESCSGPHAYYCDNPPSIICANFPMDAKARLEEAMKNGKM